MTKEPKKPNKRTTKTITKVIPTEEAVLERYEDIKKNDDAITAEFDELFKKHYGTTSYIFAAVIEHSKGTAVASKLRNTSTHEAGLVLEQLGEQIMEEKRFKQSNPEDALAKAMKQLFG